MKNLYNEVDKNEILHRLENLKVDAERQWGKMNIVQMLAHLNASIETPLGKNFPKRMFIGRIIGKLMKKKFLNDQPMAKNAPTDKMYVVTNISIDDFDKEKQKTKELITFSTPTEKKNVALTHILFLGNSLLTNGVFFNGNTSTTTWDSLEYKINYRETQIMSKYVFIPMKDI